MGVGRLELLREGLESGSLPSLFSGSYGAESPTLGCFFPRGTPNFSFACVFTGTAGWSLFRFSVHATGSLLLRKFCMPDGPHFQ